VTRILGLRSRGTRRLDGTQDNEKYTQNPVEFETVHNSGTEQPQVVTDDTTDHHPVGVDSDRGSHLRLSE